MSNQRLGEEKPGESSPFVALLPVKLVHALRHVNGFLDFTDDQDARKHLLQLFFWDWLSGVPDGAVGSNHRLRGQVEGVVATFSTLWTDREKHRAQREDDFRTLNEMSKSQCEPKYGEECSRKVFSHPSHHVHCTGG